MPTLFRHQGTPPAPLPNTRPTLRWAAVLSALIPAVLLALFASPAAADPMRPLPAALPSAAPTAQPDAGRPAQAAPAAPPVRRLLAIRQDNNGERAALFGDRWVRVGDSFMTPEGHTLVLSIGPTHIEWEQGRVRSTHYLLAPLLPAQWPTAQAAPAQASPPAPNPPAASPPAAAAPKPSASQPQTNPHRETVKP